MNRGGGGPVYRDLTAAQLEVLYNPSPGIPEFPQILERWRDDSLRVAAELPHRTLQYGGSEWETLEFFPAGGAAGAAGSAPLLLFIHGGYWQELTKDSFLYPAPAFRQAGVAYASLNYALAPAVTLDEIVRQARSATAWLWDRAPELGIDRERLFVSGHSAGGHLTAMLLLTDWPGFATGLPVRVLRGGCAISGVFDLEPLRFTSVNQALGLDAAAARRNSPLYLLEAAGPAASLLILAVGGQESSEFRRQQADFAAAWRAKGFPARVVDMPGHHHFSVVDQVAVPGDPLHETVMSMIRGEVEA